MSGFALRALHGDFGAELSGLDLSRDLTGEAATALVAALDRHGLLFLPQPMALAPERQVALVRLLGEPSDNGSGRLWSVLDNAGDAGAMTLPFHCDLSYTDAPIALISLYAQALPEGGTTTSFVSNVAAWAGLPADLQARLAPLHLRHRHVSRLPGDWPVFTAVHPLAAPHPRSGAPMLFVTEHHAERILELDEAQSAAMLSRLFAHLYAAPRIYTHRWRPHDLLLWDNRAVQHARRAPADPAAGARRMRRVVIGDTSFTELVARARQRERAA
ncbi:MAG: TauD/TfdA family dioxygenase [Sphingomonadales bacterium]|nr:TauD/TfdA family dioxygenase [Sphingomonadales bacterium]